MNNLPDDRSIAGIIWVLRLVWWLTCVHAVWQEMLIWQQCNRWC